jgi:hypothetical protein
MPILSANSTEYQSAVRSEEKADIRDAQAAVGALKIQQVVKKLPTPTDDPQLIPGTPSGNFQEAEASYSESPVAEHTAISNPSDEPDPSVAIDYVIKKRKF